MPSPSERDLFTELIAALMQLPGARVSHSSPVWESGIKSESMHVDLGIPGIAPLQLDVKRRKSVYPADVRELAWQARTLEAAGSPKKRRLVVLAEAISPGAKELLREHDVGYLDSAGNLYLRAPEFGYIWLEHGNAKPISRAVRSLFSERRGQVLQVMLNRPATWFSGKELAETTNVASSTVSQTLKELDRFGWLESRGLGPNKERRISAPAQVLDAWTKEVAERPQPEWRGYFVPVASTDVAAKQVAQVFYAYGVRSTFTREYAAQKYAPFLSSVSKIHCRTYSHRADSALEAISARPVNEGANLLLVDAEWGDESPPVSDQPDFANPIQVYLDLVNAEGRGPEMAQHLRQEVIKF